MVKMDFPDRVREFRFGGADRDQMLFLEAMKQLYSWQAGNLDSQGGLSPQTSTFHGDELLRDQSSAQLDDFKNRTAAAFKRAYQALGFHWWHNPHLTYEASRQVAEMDVPVSITPQMRQIPWEKLDSRHRPLLPGSRHAGQSSGNRLMQFCTQFLLPLQGALAQAGMQTQWPGLDRPVRAVPQHARPGRHLEARPTPRPAGRGRHGAGRHAEAAHEPAVTTRNTVRRGACPSRPIAGTGR
jgi:hypothetical protein